MAFPANLLGALHGNRTERDALRATAGVLQQDIAPPPGRPHPDAEAGDAAVPDRIFPLAGAKTGDGGVGEFHPFPACHRSALQHAADRLGSVTYHGVRKVDVFQRRFRLAVAEQPADRQHGLTLPESKAGISMA